MPDLASRVLHLDFETYSPLEIGDVGLENYISAPGFTVTVVAWAFDDEPVQSLVWPNTKELPGEVRRHIHEIGRVEAHNAAFEFAVLHDHYQLDVEWSQMDCTMQRALAFGLPAGLLKAGVAINAPIIKDETVRLLMLRMSRPNRKDNKAPHMDPEKSPAWLAKLADYCKNDVAAERALSKLLPKLHVYERELSLLDHRINRKGIRVQVADVDVLRRAAEVVDNDINTQLAVVTCGYVSTTAKRIAMKTWLGHNGLSVPSKGGLTAEAVEKLLANRVRMTMPRSVEAALRLYQKGSKSSVAKLVKMTAVPGAGDRARNLLQFYGAGRTGRWAGRLIQPHNMPRVGKGHDAVQVIDAARMDYASIGMLWASPLDQISQSLRALFVAEPGKVLVSVDFSQIEARVLAWLADQLDVVSAFARGEDVYTLQAAKVGSSNRQLGKVLVLACGFGMGWSKFQDTAGKAPYYIVLSDEAAQKYLYGWRQSNAHIIDYWTIVEVAVANSVSRPGMIIPLPHGMAVLTRDVLGRRVTQIRKPNTVKLTYHNMRFEDGGLVFDGVNSYTKQWQTERTYGGRLVENIVQSIARDIMAEAMLRVQERFRLVPVMTVHDEIVWELTDDGKPGASPLKLCAEEVPVWARGLPVASELKVGSRYGK
jgi:DNA polymerase I - 3''-5'' exonuclease and polymerase domains